MKRTHRTVHSLTPEMMLRPLKKNGKPRQGQGLKATITEKRLMLRTKLWNQVKSIILQHLQNSPKGEASRMARALGLNPSQIHRFTCPVCEHDQEPTFSVGAAALLYVSFQSSSPVSDISTDVIALRRIRTNKKGESTYY